MSQQDFDINQVQLRSAEERDYATIRELYREGLLGGQASPRDTGADIENLYEGYFSDGGHSAFWVADYQDQIIGMIGVQKCGENSGEVRRLRVRKNFRRLGVGARLVEQALNFCREHEYLKVTLDVREERFDAISLLEKLGFNLTRKREIEGRNILDFYMDLYSDPK